jgi:hypothetical protein
MHHASLDNEYPEELRLHDIAFDHLWKEFGRCGAQLLLQPLAVPKAWTKKFLFGMFFEEFPRSQSVLCQFR